MSATASALIGLVSVSLALMLVILGVRGLATLSGKKKINEFSPEGSDVSEFSGRLCRAHANCYENLPVSASILLLAIATSQTAITDTLAMYILYARVGQVVVHLISTSPLAVVIRATFWLLQVLMLICLAYRLATLG